MGASVLSEIVTTGEEALAALDRALVRFFLRVRSVNGSQVSQAQAKK